MRTNFILLLTLLLLALSGCSRLDSDQSIWNENEIEKIKFDRTLTPTNKELIVINFILSNTSEVNSHQMRGEEENTVYIKEDPESTGCLEAVFDANGDLVKDGYNEGSYNYYCYEEYPIKHFNSDILPWLLWGNEEDDPTSFDERLYYYTLDLNRGIQSYIFADNFDYNKVIDFDSLPEDEKMAYRFFTYLIFNSEYSIKLEENHLNQLKEDGDFYFDYFDQIQTILSLKKEDYIN